MESMLASRNSVMEVFLRFVNISERKGASEWARIMLKGIVL
jgi:hypothetical protein